MYRRRWWFPAITLSAVLVAAACSGGGGGGGSGGTQAPQSGAASGGGAGASAGAGGEKTTFRLTTWAGEDEAKELQELVLDKINGEATDFEVVHEPAPADYYTKLQTTLAGGTGADFMWLSQEYVAGYASRGALLDLTDHLAAVDSPAASLDDYFPDVVAPAKYQDRVYGLPWIAQPVVLYYNPELFDAAGVDPPDDSWDWETFREAAVELTTGEQYGFTANGWPPLQQFIWQAGGEVITDDLSSSPIDSPEAMEAVEFYQSLIWNEECCPSEETITEQGFGEMFKGGKVAMFMGGAADTFDGLDVVGASVVPKGPDNRANLSYVAVTAVNSATKNPELAAKALAALTDAIHHWKIVAPRPDLATAETILASIPEKWKAQKEGQVDAIVAATEEMRAFNVIPRHQEWDGLFWSEFQDPIFHEKSTVAEAAPAAREKLEALLP